jgi:mannose-6-phosphate isomerase
MTLCPARLEPTFSPRPWGSRSLAPYFPQMTRLAEPIGEAWFTGNDSRFANGPFAGRSLGAVWPQMPVEWAGAAVQRGRDFPLLVKFIFPEDKLSVQVHPDDEYASANEKAAGGCGKTEMWYAVEARPGAEVLVGLKPGVTRESFSQAISGGTAEDCLEHIPLQAGESVFVSAGTAHTIGPGLVLCEVQQNSDLTYRVYDYNRRDARGRTRELHVEKALEVMRFGDQGSGKIEPVQIRRGNMDVTYHAVCGYFATEEWSFAAQTNTESLKERFALLIFLEGSGEIQWGADRSGYAAGQVWLIPAALGKFGLAPAAPTKLLRTFVPETAALKRELESSGMTESQWLSLVHA